MKFKLLFITMLLAGCAHHNNVRESADGIHTVVLQAENKASLSDAAYKQAKHYCAEKNKIVTVVSENIKFEGTMDEKSYQQAKGAAGAIQTVGSAAILFGDRKAKQAGGVAVIGSEATDAYLGDQKYRIDYKFKCD